MQSKRKIIIDALKCAFPYTVPIFLGFWFIGLTYGIYMHVSGFSFWYPMVMSLTIFGGSLEFVTVSMLLAPYAPVQALIMTLVIQARHLFYGISMLEKFKDMGWKRRFRIFGLCDETFSINYTADIPEGIDRGWFYFFVTLLNYFYWFSGATTGGLVGNLLQFNTQGLDFVMTALFVVIFTEQWLKEKRHICEWVGLAASVGCLLAFGPDHFMIPTLVCILIGLTAFRKVLESEMEGKES